MRGRILFATMLTLSAAAVLLNVYAQHVTRDLRPFVPFADLVLSATVGVVFAVSALAAWHLGAHIPAVLLLLGSVVHTFSVFFEALQPTSSWWALFYALSPALGIVVILLVITYPTGRLSGWVGRGVLIAAVGFFAAQTLLILVAETGEWCLCAPNPFLVLPRGVVVWWYQARLVIGAALSLAAVIALIARWIRGSRPWRASNVLMTVTAFSLAVTTAWTNLNHLLTLDDEREGWAYLRLGLTIAVPLVWIAGLAAFRQARARVADVVLAAKEGVTAGRWDQLIQSALDDHSARVIWLQDGEYRTVDGSPVTPPPHAVAVGEDTPVRAWIVFDPAVAVRRDLLASLSASISIVTENVRLTDELSRSIQRLRESRMRIVDAADGARRQLERDLHDGAQQLLLAASFSLDRARDQLNGDDSPELAERLAQTSEELGLARRELRELARGITPTILDHGGLDGAMEELVMRSPVPASLRIRGQTRPVADAVAKTLYFTVAESLTNAARHAGPATASVDLGYDDELTVTITDNGRGGARITGSGGLRGLADRVEAVGGLFRVDAPLEGGTRVSASIPPTRWST
ncbi:histidine kinase [Microbacterium sp.]|uniref:sensor histidine kinase n=1 Tax=Microbacterium sp. TaxID=51671 RepID=UPI003C759D8B